jgi:hypothetical protein
MGTGAVYLLLSSLNPHPPWLVRIEVVFFGLNAVIFSSNVLTLLLQCICECPVLNVLVPSR